MRLYIAADIKPEDVKRQFSSCYPFLKIELYKQHKDSNGKSKKDAGVVHQFTNLTGAGFVDIDNDVTVAQLEHSFAILGLKAEVFRRCGNVWVETLLTNSWTLQQQNTEAEEISNHV